MGGRGKEMQEEDVAARTPTRESDGKGRTVARTMLAHSKTAML